VGVLYSAGVVEVIGILVFISEFIPLPKYINGLEKLFNFEADIVNK
jgi:hypothetical protein